MSLERHIETRRYKRDCKRYAAYLERMRQLELQRAPPPPSAGDSASVTVAECGSVTPAPDPQPPLRRKTKLKAPQLKAKAKSEGFVAPGPVYDMDNFQDPQVASHRPLDMERPFTI